MKRFDGFIRRHHALFALECQSVLAVPSGSSVHSEVDLSTVRVKDWYYDRRVRRGLRRNRFQAAYCSDWLYVNLGPAFYGCKSYPQSGERPRAGRYGKKIKLAEVQMKILQEKFQVAKH